MILVKPRHEIMDIMDFDSCHNTAKLSIIEEAGRTCYKSKLSESNDSFT